MSILWPCPLSKHELSADAKSGHLLPSTLQSLLALRAAGAHHPATPPLHDVLDHRVVRAQQRGVATAAAGHDVAHGRVPRSGEDNLLCSRIQIYKMFVHQSVWIEQALKFCCQSISLKTEP